MGYQEQLTAAIDETIAPGAEEADRTGTFPRGGIERLGKEGILGLVSATEVGGGGQGLRGAADVVERLAQACSSTAMIVTMHYSATVVIEAHGPLSVRREVAEGRHLSTLAFSEPGSRSHFWVPLSTVTAHGDEVRLDSHKSWATSAGQADSYVWSSRPLAAEGPMSLWLVPSASEGLRVDGPFDGLGLRANASSPMVADGVRMGRDALLGPDGGGLDIALGVVLPWFLVLNAAASLGLMEATVAEVQAQAGRTHFEHLNQNLVDQVVPRANLARMRIETDKVRAFIADTIGALEAGRADAMLRVLEVKVVAAEAAVAVTDLALQVGGGAAFRKEVGIERRFRDARASRVMAPTTDALLDFVGRAISGLPLLDPPAA